MNPTLNFDQELVIVQGAGIDDAFLPIDQGAVTVGGNPFDGFETGEGHGGGALCQ